MRAAAPPKPPHMLTPPALLHLEATAGTVVRVFKRDQQCFFDQLGLPEELRQWFGRPSLTCGELLRCTDMTWEELRRHYGGAAELHHGLALHPLCAVWPMGFAWSSFLAQSTLLAYCLKGGFTLDQMLADDLPTPADPSLSFALATDDLMVFSVGSATLARQLVSQTDTACAEAGLQRNAAKDVSNVADATCVGIDVEGGVRVCPHVNKLALLAAGLAYLFEQGAQVSPLELYALLGHLTWIGLLNRPSLSCFHDVYVQAREGATDARKPLGSAATTELLLFTALLPLLEGDLTRPWQEHLVSSDASSGFGFGVDVAAVPPSLAREVARRGARAATYVRLDRGEQLAEDEAERPRAGKCLPLPLAKSAFRTVISKPAAYAAHSGTLEAHAVVLALRWLLRSVGRHSRRTPVLVDAQTVIGALRTGRSSAPTLRTEIMRASALIIGGDLLMHYIYVPSEDNPSDASSRGIVRRWRARPATTRRQQKVVRPGIGKRPAFTAASIKRRIRALTHAAAPEVANSWRRLFRAVDSDATSVASL